MALNLGATLRDAVDGPVPGLDEVAGEDPADIDLPALSARIRHRRRVQAAGRSAVGVAAVGVLALAGVQAGMRTGALAGVPGLGGRGAETAGVSLTSDAAALCGQDVATMPAIDGGGRLVPLSAAVVFTGTGGVGVAGDSTDLGALVGRTMTATLVQGGGAGTASPGHVVLTRGSTVVAVLATPLEEPSSPNGLSVASAALAPCPSAAGTPASVPSGTYTVQYIVPVVSTDAGTGLVTSDLVARSSAGPWLLTLLDEPPAPALPDGYPAGEVPVVGGKLLSAAPQDAASAAPGWTVQVAVDGDDAVTRATTALRTAGADVTREPGLNLAAPATPDGQDLDAITAGADLAALQTQRAAAADELTTAQKAYHELTSAHADADTMAGAVRELQAATARLSGLDEQIAAAQLDLAVQQQRDAAQAAATQTYSAVPTSLDATTRSWSVHVTQGVQDGRTVLTYLLTAR